MYNDSHQHHLQHGDEKPLVYDPCLPRLPSQQMNAGSQGSSNGLFSRQDSLAICSRLQEADRGRNYDMVDFMETNMDINEYIQCFENLDVPAEQVDLDENELQKANLLYDNPDMHNVNDYYDPTTSYNNNPTAAFDEWVPEQEQLEGSAVSSVSGECSRAPSAGMQHSSTNSSPFARPSMHQQPLQSDLNLVKAEPQWDREQEPSTSAASAPRRRVRDASVELQTYKPQTKARKYQLKADEEKSNPNYKLKRARNNDAVRKSRTKQKEEQLKRELELQGLRDEVTRLTAALAVAHKMIEDNNKTIARLAGGRRNN